MTFYESWVIRFRCTNRHQRKTTLLDWHCNGCSLFLKLPTVKKTTTRLIGGSTFYSTPINNVEFLKQVWPSSLTMFHNFADFSFVPRCATLCNEVLYFKHWFNFFRCDQKYWIRLPSLFNIAQQSCIQGCWIMLNEFGRGIKFANEKRKEREPTKLRRSQGWRLREGGSLNP